MTHLTSLFTRDLLLPVAYLQKSPIVLKTGQRLPVQPLRTLASHYNIIQPIRHLREAPKMGLILTALIAADILHLDNNQLTISQTAQAWLDAPNLLDQLANTTDSTKWATIAEQLKLTITPLDARWFYQQCTQLQRGVTNYQPIHIQCDSSTQWTLHLPSSIPPRIEFELRQFTAWHTRTQLHLTPTTLAATLQASDLPTICYWLSCALMTSLPTNLQDELYRWQKQMQRFHLRPVYLLSVTDPADMSTLWQKRRARRHITETISPRHAVVDPRIRTYLDQAQATIDTAEITPNKADTWLALAVLNRLHTLCHLPITPPRTAMNQLATEIDPPTLTALSQHANNIIGQLKRAIAGTDHFRLADDITIDNDLIMQAIAQEKSIDIDYQSLAADHPTTRRISPLHVEQRGDIVYLSAFCHRANENRTFRLDRIHAIHPIR